MSLYKLSFSDCDINDPASFELKLAEAAEFFRLYGYLYVEDVISTGQADTLSSFIAQKMVSTGNSNSSLGKLEVGDRRYMIPMVIGEEKDYSPAFAHPLLLSLTQKILGGPFVLDSFGAVVSQPGATDQSAHRDGHPLYGGNGSLDTLLPCYAITLSIPLIGITAEVGGTTLYEGSHRQDYNQTGLPSSERYHLCKKGSLIMWDYRLLHFGMANRTNLLRPLLYFVFSRPWYHDAVSFSKKIRPVRIKRSAFDSLSESEMLLFRYTAEIC